MDIATLTLLVTQLATMLGVVYFLSNRIDRVREELIGEIKAGDAATQGRIDDLDHRLTGRMDRLEGRMDELERRLTSRIDELERRLTSRIDRAGRCGCADRRPCRAPRQLSGGVMPRRW